ncbi:MAG: formate dehydrogenase accessory sulfurtransferase FdhD [Deltaproteobacteria bacterium]|nr:formate dehydrogenase accessory sulfurtransferase FdhD [Deltaproteobacteria bacterium]MBW2393935.1 formate dehydrogenase accessory sulfurtransferase FdhD [Deltaproteobacteria bacterium]
MTRLRDHGVEASSDRVAHEEPLEIQVGGTPLAVLMRTPGHDLELATGFLITEGIVSSRKALASVHHQSGGDDDANVIRVNLADEAEVDLESLRRSFVASSSCGVCGKGSLEIALRVAPALDDLARFEPRLFPPLLEQLRAAQVVFEETGGLHAAGLFDREGRLLVAREDVGRHNAVDKTIGWALRNDLIPLEGHILLVSGRISFEIVQKALAARIPAVAAVSAPTSLAVELARKSGMLLVAFLREDRLNGYGARERLVAS